MAILGFDFGAKRIGVAIVPDDMNFALPLATAEGDVAAQWAVIDDLIKKNNPVSLVVGLPTNTAGEEGEEVQAVHKFVAELTARYNLPVNLVDERFTSKAAANLGAADIDASSAALILDSYLAQAAPEEIFDL